MRTQQEYLDEGQDFVKVIITMLWPVYNVYNIVLGYIMLSMCACDCILVKLPLYMCSVR